MKSLNELFKIGEIVRCYIKETSIDAIKSSTNRIRYILSLNPKLVNKGVLKKHIKLQMSIVGAVISVEDHGYVIDSGIPDLKCFLPKSEICGTFVT